MQKIGQTTTADKDAKSDAWAHGHMPIESVDILHPRIQSPQLRQPISSHLVQSGIGGKR